MQLSDLPVWQALHEELAPLGLSVVTVALDFDPAVVWWTTPPAVSLGADRSRRNSPLRRSHALR